MSGFLARSYSIAVNGYVRIEVIPWVPRAPWPPRHTETWEDFQTRDEAARLVLSTSSIVVTPDERDAVTAEAIQFPERETPCTILWYPRALYERLVDDVERWYERPSGEQPRLHDLGDGPLAMLLRDHLPRAALGDYERRILCLPPA